MNPNIALLTLGVDDLQRAVAFYGVNDVMRQAEQAGARIVKPGHKTLYGGYAGYFTDSDEHLWVAFNPGFASLG